MDGAACFCLGRGYFAIFMGIFGVGFCNRLILGFRSNKYYFRRIIFVNRISSAYIA
jgi:hypothetical protein